MRHPRRFWVSLVTGIVLTAGSAFWLGAIVGWRWAAQSFNDIEGEEGVTLILYSTTPRSGWAILAALMVAGAASLVIAVRSR